MDNRATCPVALFLLALLLGFLGIVELPAPGGLSLRVAASDVFLLPSLALLVWSGPWRVRFQVRAVPWAVVLLTILLCVAAASGVWHHSRVTSWILLNKLLGWFVLVAYFYVGALSAGRFSADTQTLAHKVLLAGSIASCSVAIGLWELLNIGAVQPVPWPVATILDEVLGVVWGQYRMSGLLVNSSSFAYVLNLVVLLILPRMGRDGGLKAWPVLFGVSVLVLCIFYSGSRSAMVALALGFGVLLLLGRIPWRRVGAVLAVAIVLAAAMQVPPMVHNAILNDGAVPYADVLAPNITNKKESISHRAEGYAHALELWRGSPLTGVGLGGVLSEQIARGIAQPQVIHNTWLWLLTEAGPLALIAYALLLFAALRAQWQMARAGHSFAASMAAIIVMTAAISLLHEMMYQRFFWFLLGIAVSAGRPATRTAKGMP